MAMISMVEVGLERWLLCPPPAVRSHPGPPAGPAGGRDGALREGVQQSLLEDLY